MRRARAVAAATLIAVLAGGAAARAASAPTVVQLVDRNRIATGIDDRAALESESWALHANGLDGVMHVARKGAATRTDLSLGPFTSVRGFAGGRRWHQTDNGEIVVETDPAQIPKPVSERVTRTRRAVESWLVTATYPDGTISRTFYDPATWLITRSERFTGDQTSWTAYGDFRSDSRGRMRPWMYAGGSDRPGSGYEYRLLRDEEPAAFPLGTFGIPRAGRDFVAFPGGVRSVRLPARIIDGRVYVRVTIAGHGLDFLLDTGSASMTIDGGVARGLRLRGYGPTPMTVAGTFSSERVTAPRIDVGPLAMRDVVLRTAPVATREPGGIQIVGLLGYDFFGATALRIDYGAGTVDAYRPRSLAPARGALPVEMRLGSQVPLVRASLDRAASDAFMLDTGAQFGYVVLPRFIRVNGAQLARQPKQAVDFASGIGGSLPYRSLGRMRLVIGSTIAIDDGSGIEALTAGNLGTDGVDGIVGSDTLRRFGLVLDYAQNRAWFELPSRSPDRTLRTAVVDGR